MVERLGLARLRRHQDGLSARRLDGIPRVGQLHLLDSLVRDHERHRLAVQSSTHLVTPRESSIV